MCIYIKNADVKNCINNVSLTALNKKIKEIAAYVIRTVIKVQKKKYVGRRIKKCGSLHRMNNTKEKQNPMKKT